MSLNWRDKLQGPVDTKEYWDILTLGRISHFCTGNSTENQLAGCFSFAVLNSGPAFEVDLHVNCIEKNKRRFHVATCRCVVQEWMASIRVRLACSRLPTTSSFPVTRATARASLWRHLRTRTSWTTSPCSFSHLRRPEPTSARHSTKRFDFWERPVTAAITAIRQQQIINEVWSIRSKSHETNSKICK